MSIVSICHLKTKRVKANWNWIEMYLTLLLLVMCIFPEFCSTSEIMYFKQLTLIVFSELIVLHYTSFCQWCHRDQFRPVPSPLLSSPLPLLLPLLLPHLSPPPPLPLSIYISLPLPLLIKLHKCFMFYFSTFRLIGWWIMNSAKQGNQFSIYGSRINRQRVVN